MKPFSLILFIALFSCSTNKKLFQDAPNTAVFTTCYVVKEKHLITEVYHDEDGSWQFFSDDIIENIDSCAMLVSLNQIVKLDQSILEISDLKQGYVAKRKSLTDSWVIEKQN